MDLHGCLEAPWLTTFHLSVGIQLSVTHDLINGIEHKSVHFRRYNCSKINLFAHGHHHETIPRYTVDVSLYLSNLTGVRGRTDGGVVLLHLVVSDL
jgi:hypothetical protein